MQFNSDSSFVGLDKLKQRHQTQIVEFETWASRNSWENFHSAHYDWWAFPIDRGSSYGLTWTVFDGDVAALKTDQNFLRRYVRGVELVAASWGWDVHPHSPIASPVRGQCWHHWPVRLFKAALSVRLFDYSELFGSLKLYSQQLMGKGEPMAFNGKDLSWLFTTGIDPYEKYK